MEPALGTYKTDNTPSPLLIWRFPEPRLALASGPLGGGIGPRSWVLNASVPIHYARPDPDRHLTEIAAQAGLPATAAGPSPEPTPEPLRCDAHGPVAGVGLLTAVDVTGRRCHTDGGAHATATVGVGSPSWAAAPDGHLRREHGGPDGATIGWRPGDPPPVGTINLVIALPVRLSEAALVNAATTATEAKCQALWEAGVQATGTASDALCVHCPATGTAEPYGGPRSTWGARLARAVHATVLAGTRHWLGHPESSAPAGQR